MSKVIASFLLDLAAALGVGLNHADHGQMREAGLVGVAAVGKQPIDFVADDMMALFDAAMVGVGGLEGSQQPSAAGSAKKVSTSA